MKLHERLKKALLPMVGEEDSLENRERIIKIVLNILPTATSFDAEVMAVGILKGQGIDESKKTIQEEKTEGTRSNQRYGQGSGSSERN